MQNLPPGSSSTGQAPGGALSALDPLRVLRVIEADPDAFTKCGIVFLIFLIPFVGWMVVLGWLTYALRRAHANVTPILLPAPTDLTVALDYGEQGLKAFVVGLCWTLPTIVFTLCFVGCIWFGVAGSVMAAAQGGDMGGFVVVLAMLAGFVGFLVLAVINTLLSIPAAIAVLRAEMSGVLAEGFAVSPVLATFRAQLGAWILNLLMLMLIQLVVAMVSSFVPLIGILVSSYVLVLMRGFAMLSVYEYVLVASGTEAFPVGPLAPAGMRG